MNGMQNKLARVVIDRVPCLETVRFVNSGTEACLSVLRLMRAYTGRNKVHFPCMYNGQLSALMQLVTCAHHSIMLYTCLLPPARHNYHSTALLPDADICLHESSSPPASSSVFVYCVTAHNIDLLSRYSGAQVFRLLPWSCRLLLGASRIWCSHTWSARLARSACSFYR